jgi:hypothetical protein
MRHITRGVVPMMVCVLLGGCITDGPSAPDPVKTRPMPREVTHPVSLAVSPLTRVGQEGMGGPSLFLHLDFRDASGKSVKAFGRVRVELFEPGSAGTDSKTQAVKQAWDVDLSDALKNALTFDEMITRTYTINLTGIPDWLLQWAKKGEGSGGTPPSIIVQFAPSGSTDASGVLRVAYALTR